MQIIGIVFGMITMGYIGDTIGRKWGSVMTVCIMSVGAILLTALNGTSEKGFVVSQQSIALTQSCDLFCQPCCSVVQVLLHAGVQVLLHGGAESA